MSKRSPTDRSKAPSGAARTDRRKNTGRPFVARNGDAVEGEQYREVGRILEFLIVNVVFPVALGVGAWLVGIASFDRAMKVVAAVMVGAALGAVLVRAYERASAA